MTFPSTDWPLTLNIGNFRCEKIILVRISVTKEKVIDITSANLGNSPTKRKQEKMEKSWKEQ